MTKKILVIIPLLLFGYLLYLAFTGTLPMALDIVTGIYYPWLNHHYLGLSTWTPVHNPYISDVSSQAVVWRLFLAEHLARFSSIFWHNFSLSGYPYLGSAYLTPLLHPSTLFLFLPLQLGISLVFLFQLLAVFAAGYFFLRSLQLSSTVSLIGAFALSLGGQLTTWFELGALSYVVASLLLSLTLINHSKFRALPLAVFLLINSGHYQYVLYALIFLFAYGLWQRSFFPSLKSLVLGLLLSSVILLPTYQVYSHSIRESDNFLSLRNSGLISVRHLVTLLNPDHFGNPVTYNYVGEEDYQEKSPYVGIIFLPLFLYSFMLWKRNRTIKFFGIVTLASLLLMTDNPVSNYLLALPIPLLGNSKGSRPLVFFDLSLIISSLLALPHLLKHRRHLLILALITIFFTLTYFVTVLPNYNPRSLLDLILHPPVRDAVGGAAITTFRTSLIPVFLSLVFSIGLLLKARFAKFPLVLLLGLIIMFDLSRYFTKYNTFADSEIFYPVTPEFAFLQRSAETDLFRTEYYGTAGVPMNIWEAYHLESASGYTSIYPKRYGEFVGIVNDDKINHHPGRFVHIFRPQSPLFDLLNIKYVLVNFSDCPDGNGNNIVCQVVQHPKFKQVLLQDNMAIYQNTQVLPRFFIPRHYLVRSNDAEISSALASPQFVPDDTVILEQDPNLPPELGTGAIKVDTYSSTHIKLTATEVSAPTLLYIGNTYDPGWQARIDGVAVPILRANYTFAAIPLAQGDHKIELIYFPPGLLQGLVLSLFTLLLYLWSIMKPKIT